MPKIRCINLDWLEVYVLEPRPLTPEYFEGKGYRVRVRAYGTPMYRQMFTVYSGKRALVEVRRMPYSCKSEGGIFDDNSVHLRLPNQMCYSPYPVQFLQSFIRLHNYQYKSTTRLDFCMDFNTFDYNRNVPNFIRSYMAGRYFKMNQSQLAAHGADSWPIRDYWSLKWGSPYSPITTKLYDKTAELTEAGHDKPYIWDAWLDAGLNTELPIYRVEFSIKGAQIKELMKEESEQKKFINTDTGEIIRGKIDKSKYIMLDFNAYPTREECLFTFMALANKYFDFRESSNTRNGTPQRRDRCPRVTLFISSPDEQGYKPHRTVTQPMPGRTDKILANRLIDMSQDSDHYDSKFRDTCKVVAAQLLREKRYKEHGIELPDNQEDLRLISPRPTMSDKQFREYMAESARKQNEFEKRWLARQNEYLQTLRNANQDKHKWAIVDALLDHLQDKPNYTRQMLMTDLLALFDTHNFADIPPSNEFGDLPF